jgi:hypothetical protein
MRIGQRLQSAKTPKGALIGSGHGLLNPEILSEDRGAHERSFASPNQVKKECDLAK